MISYCNDRKIRQAALAIGLYFGWDYDVVALNDLKYDLLNIFSPSKLV